MNAAEQLARMQEWLDTHPAPIVPRDEATHEDEDTLRRSRGGLSRQARREQRRPRPMALDEQGYAPTGTWVPS